MSEEQRIQVANDADIIVNGYAFTRDGERLRVLNLNNTDRAAVVTVAGEVLETSMDNIELRIVLDYLTRNIALVVE